MNDRNRLKEVAQIKSFSNEIIGGTGKSSKHTFTFDTQTSVVSPVIELNSKTTRTPLPAETTSPANETPRTVVSPTSR